MQGSTLTTNEENVNQKNFKILVVDDEPGIINVVQGFLDAEDYTSENASNGFEALEKMKNTTYDLVITDVKMPGMTGVEVAEAVNNISFKTKIIFITGYAEYDTVLKAIKTRPFGFVEKPFSPKNLLVLVNKAFELWQQSTEDENSRKMLERAVAEQTDDLRFQNERLLAEKELMQGLISQANFGLIATDINQAVHIMNQFAGQCLQVDAQYFSTYIGMPLDIIVPMPALKILLDVFYKVVKDPKLHETHYVDADTERELHIISYPISFRGKITAVVFVINDITEKQILQKRLLQSAKLASIGELAAGVAHEINNPLGFVTSNCNRLDEYVGQVLKYVNLRDKGDGDQATTDEKSAKELREEYDIEYISEDVPELLAETLEGLGRVSKIVRDLKTFARVDSDDQQQHNVNSLIDDALNLVRNEIKYKLEVKKDYAELSDIMCFPNQLVQVFTNLFINASHAIEEKGTLTITTRADDSWVKIEIADDGAGIKENVLPKIFDPFFTTKEPGKGTGMGLSISYGIIEKHGGKITVASKVGEGTVFKISLPKKQPDSAVQEAENNEGIIANG